MRYCNCKNKNIINKSDKILMIYVLKEIVKYFFIYFYNYCILYRWYKLKKLKL